MNDTEDILDNIHTACVGVGMLVLGCACVGAFLWVLGACEVVVDGIPQEYLSGCGKLFMWSMGK